MKLRTLAIAVAMASVPFAAQADLTISGDISTRYISVGGADGAIDFGGSEVNFDGSTKSDSGITYKGHAELDMSDLSNTTATFDELYVSASGGFGTVTIGDVDNACDAKKTGGTFETWLDIGNSGGCGSGKGDTGIIRYDRGFGPMAGSISYGPEQEEFSVGLSGTFGKHTIALGHTTNDSGDSSLLSGSTTFGPATLRMRLDDESDWGVSAKVGPAHLGTNNDGDVYAGYSRALSSATTFAVDLRKPDGASDTDYAIGLVHTF